MIAKTKPPADVIYPESDGMPLPDAEFQAPLYREIVSTLATHFKDLPNCNVNGNTFIYYVEGDIQRRFAPDCYAVFNIDKSVIEYYDTYLLWEVGKAPDFILEIGSRSTARIDLVAKRRLYADIGVTEYWRFDSTGGTFYRAPLVGELLVDGDYRPLPMHREADGIVWGHSDTLRLDLVWQEGRLRFYDPQTGIWLMNQEEEKAARPEGGSSAADRRSAGRGVGG